MVTSIKSTASKSNEATMSKLEQARAEFAAKQNVTHEHEPEVVHAAAIASAMDAAPSWTRRAIGFVAGIFASAGTYYYGALAANLLLAAVGPGFIGFFMYMLCLALLWLGTIAAGWVVNGAVVSGNVVTKVTGWFGAAKAKVLPAKSEAATVAPVAAAA